MKILLVANYLPDKQESMLRFANLLVEALQPHGHEVRLIRPPVRLNRSQASYEEKGKWWGYIDKFLLFPHQLKKAARWADVIHICDHSNAHYVKTIQHQPHLITCHDLIAINAALDSHSTIKRSGKILQNLILEGLKKVELFACVSDNTRKEVMKLTGISEFKAKTIYNGINYPYTIMPEAEANRVLDSFDNINREKNRRCSSFVLHVGGNQPYKNRMGVLIIYQQLRSLDTAAPQLIMIGKPWTDEMREFIAKNDLESSVTEVKHCSNQELCAFYSLAQVFLFPSLAEGFGWPVIEAQACGCRVLTSNFAPLTEVGGEAALYCDPRDEKEAAHRLKDLLDEDETQRATRIAAGLKTITRFTPQAMIEGYLALYQKAIHEQAAPK